MCLENGDGSGTLGSWRQIVLSKKNCAHFDESMKLGMDNFKRY